MVRETASSIHGGNNSLPRPLTSSCMKRLEKDEQNLKDVLLNGELSCTAVGFGMDRERPRN